MSDDTIKKNISKNIAKYREAANISQKELAKRLGVVPSRISNWETGANCPTIDILFEVCEILNVSINDIYGVYPDSKFVLKYGEQDLLKKYRGLDDHGKEMVDFTLEKEYERSIAEKKKSDNIVPMAVKESSDYELNAAHAGCSTAHRADLVFVKADRLAVVSRDEDVLFAVGQSDVDQRVVLVEAQRAQTCAADILKIGEHNALRNALTGDEEQELIVRKLLNREHCGDFFTVFQLVNQFVCFFDHGEIGTETGVKYRVKTKHAQSSVDFANRIFAGSDAEFFSNRHTDCRGYLDNDPFIWGIKCLPYSF